MLESVKKEKEKTMYRYFHPAINKTLNNHVKKTEELNIFLLSFAFNKSTIQLAGLQFSDSHYFHQSSDMSG